MTYRKVRCYEMDVTCRMHTGDLDIYVYYQNLSRNLQSRDQSEDQELSGR